MKMDSKLYLMAKDIAYSKIRGAPAELSLEDTVVDNLLKDVINYYGLNAIRNNLNQLETIYLKRIVADKEFWNDIIIKFKPTIKKLMEEKEMGVYKEWLKTVEKGLAEKWMTDETRTQEEIHNLAIAGCCLWVNALEEEWSNGTISKERDKWLEKITSDDDYWTDWEEWKKTAKNPENIGMSREEYNTMKGKVEAMAEQKAGTETTAVTTVTKAEKDSTGTVRTSSSTTNITKSWYSSSYYNTAPIGFSYHGRKNKTILPDFINICKMTQKSLKRYLIKELKKYYNKENIFARDGFVFVKGEIPVMVTAHMDTVHTEVIKDYYEWTEEQKDDAKGRTYDVHVLSSPQGIGGDDRCGIWMILQMLEYGYRPFIIFNEDEEIGCVGATKFCKKGNVDLHNMCKEVKFIIELDRKGKHDLVFYDCDNEDFTKWCEETTGWKEAYGTCSDISYIAPELGCAAVNLSCGYYDEHKLWHTVKIEEMFNTLSTAIKMIEASENVERFEYVESYYSSYNSRWGNYHNNYDYDYDDNNSDKYGTCVVDFEYWAYDSKMNDWTTEFATTRGWRYSECYEKFFKNHPNTCYADITRHVERHDYTYGYNYSNNRAFVRNSYY
jgi:hypothetical protein